MNNHNGSALLVVLVVMTLLISWAGYQWRSIAYFADIAFKKQEYYQHFYETLGVLHIGQRLVQDNEILIKKISSKPLMIPFGIASLNKEQKDSSLMVHIAKKKDSFQLVALHGDRADSACSLKCVISKYSESENVDQKSQYEINGWSTKIK